jgi:hypothetical protein
MANIGLDGFLGKEEKRLVDLDWLDIKEGDYNNLPFDPIPHYIAEPKLVQQWSHEEDSSNLNLVPNSNFNFNYNMPSRMSSDIEKDVADLLNITAKEMMTGKTGAELVKAIQEKTSPMVIKAAQEHLQKLAKEQGLLGGVYIDPTVFNSCPEGSEFVAKRAKTAKFVKAMSSCAACVHNSCGRCTLYKKRIASEINYDQELFSFYSKHISSLLGRNVEIQSKDELQRAFTARKEDGPRIAEFKPKISKTTKEEEDSLEKKKIEFENQVESLKKDLDKVYGSKIAKDISSLMVRNYSAKIIKDHITSKYSSEEFNTNKQIFDYVLSKQGTLGKVYIDADMLPINTASRSDVESYLKKHASKIAIVLVRDNSENKDVIKMVCSKLDKTVVSSVEAISKESFQKEFDTYPESITSKVSSIFEKDAVKGLRLSFLQYELTKRESSAKVITENFDLQAKLDPTRYEPDMSKEASITPKKIVTALDKGYSLSSIIKIGRKLGVADDIIKANIVTALSDLTSVHKRQLDIPVNLPASVKVKVSQRDLSFELDNHVTEHTAHEISFNSSEAPVDTLVKDLDLKDSNLDLKDIDKKSSDIEISGMNEFTID